VEEAIKLIILRASPGRSRSTRARTRFGAACAAVAVLVFAASAHCQEIRFARQTSIIFLQLYVIEDQKLVEKHAERLGLKNVKTTWATFNGANMMNDALISGNVDVVTGGLTGMLILWDKTRGTPREVRGIACFASSPLYLNTWRPELRTIRDLTPDDRISLTAAKVSAQATLLQMATAKAFGDAEFAKFDPLVIAASPADATIALVSKSPSTTVAFSTPPFQEYQLRQPGIHTVLNSFDIVGGPHTSGVAWTTSEFREKNPLLYKALLAAWQEATEIITRDRRAAAALYVKKMGTLTTLDIAEEVVAGPQMQWTMTPQNTLKFAEFMQRTGVIKATAKSWKDYFFPEIYELPGS
jgi:NitT/TauT family transport system substrate-binding protein